MLEGYIVGAITALLSVIVGHTLAKPWLDQWQKRKQPKPAQQQPKQGGTP